MKSNELGLILHQENKSINNKYSIIGVDLSDINIQLYYREARNSFQELTRDKYSISGDKSTIEINDIAINNKIEAFQIIENLKFNLGEYNPIGNVDPEELKILLNKTVVTNRKLWELLKKQAFLADDSNFSRILAQINTNEVFVKTNKGYKGFPIDDVEKKIKETIKSFSEKVVGLDNNGSILVPHTGIVVLLDNYTLAKKGEIDTFTTAKKGEIDTFTTAKKGVLDTFTTAKKGVLDTFTIAKKGVLNTFTEVKKRDIDTYITNTTKPSISTYWHNSVDNYITNTTKPSISTYWHNLVDNYIVLKKGVLDTFTIAKKGEIDTFTTAKKGELKSYLDNIKQVGTFRGTFDTESEILALKSPKHGDYATHKTGTVGNHIYQEFIYDGKLAIWERGGQIGAIVDLDYATNLEAKTGTNPAKIITPKSLKFVIDILGKAKQDEIGIIEINVRNTIKLASTHQLTSDDDGGGRHIPTDNKDLVDKEYADTKIAKGANLKATSARVLEEQIENLSLKVEDNNFHGYKKLRGSTPPNNSLIPSGTSYWLSSSEEGWAAVTAELGTPFVYIECHSQYTFDSSRGVMQILRPYKPLSGKYKYGIRFGSESTWENIIYVDQDILDKERLVYGDVGRAKSKYLNKILDINESGFYSYQKLDDPNSPDGSSGYILATAFSSTSIGLIFTTPSGLIQVSSITSGSVGAWITLSNTEHKHSALDITSGKKGGFNLEKSDSVVIDSSTILATVKGVKTAHDKGKEALDVVNNKVVVDTFSMNYSDIGDFKSFVPPLGVASTTHRLISIEDQGSSLSDHYAYKYNFLGTDLNIMANKVINTGGVGNPSFVVTFIKI